jgi:hypothetical protein
MDIYLQEIPTTVSKQQLNLGRMMKLTKAMSAGASGFAQSKS